MLRCDGSSVRPLKDLYTPLSLGHAEEQPYKAYRAEGRQWVATYGYARVSTLVQADEGESLEVQRRKIEGRGLELGKKLDRVFIERGVSGSKPLNQRPQGKVLLAAVKPGDTIIASKLDRMFRSAHDALNVLEQFKKRKISLFLIDLGGDVTGDGISELVFTIMSAIAKFERGRIAERIAEVKADQRRRGRHLGGSRPFGFQISRKGTLTPVPKEQVAVRLIRRLQTRGHSLRAIADRVQQRLGLKVSHMTVQAVLHRVAKAKPEPRP
jgi:DNA invertase Pin-like site-specific DNA recombinase